MFRTQVGWSEPSTENESHCGPVANATAKSAPIPIFGVHHKKCYQPMQITNHRVGKLGGGGGIVFSD